MSYKTCLLLLVLSVAVALTYRYGRSFWVPAAQALNGKRSIADVMQHYGPAAEARLRAYFTAAQQSYPPRRVHLLALKDSQRLELWAEADASTASASPVFIHRYPIQALSGVLGPKLREGDRQVPEGIYQLEYLNPNSAYHLSLKLNYPNAFDLTHARAEGRDQPGSDIFIHGQAVSVGCLAMGDTAIEELFVLAATLGKEQIEVAIAPSDPRLSNIQALSHGQPLWVSALYRELEDYFRRYVPVP